MNHRSPKWSVFGRVLRLALLSALAHGVLFTFPGNTGAQTLKGRSSSVESLSYEETLERLNSLKPVDYYALLGTELHQWQYQNWHVDGCTLWFKDRLLLPETPNEWLNTKVSLLDLNANLIQLERQDKDGVGLRLVTDGFKDKIARYANSESVPIVELASYYINFGSVSRANKVGATLRHAIRLCKAQQANEQTQVKVEGHYTNE